MDAPLVRYPALAWDRELDAIERDFDEEPGAEIIRLDDHLSPDAIRERLAHLDRLAVGGTLLPPRSREPGWHGWLAVLLVPIAALCAVGLMIAGVG